MKARTPIGPKQIGRRHSRPETEMAVQAAVRKACSKVADRLGQLDLIRITTKPRSITLQVMTNTQGQPLISLERRANGTLKFTEYGSVENTQPAFNLALVIKKIKWRIQDELFNEICKEGNVAVTREALIPYANLKYQVKQESALIVNEAIVSNKPTPEGSTPEQPISKANTLPTHSNPSTPQNSTPQSSTPKTPIPTKGINRNNFKRSVQQLLNQHFIQNDIMDLARRVLIPYGYQNPKVTTAIYNCVVLNPSIFRELHASSPYPTKYYLLQIADQSPTPPRLKHPGQVISEVKEQLNLTPAEWSYFCRIPHYCRTMPGQPTIAEQIRQSMNLLAQLNVPDASDTALENINSFLYQHNIFRQAAWDPGDPFLAWVQTIRQYLLATTEYQRQNAPHELPEPGQNQPRQNQLGQNQPGPHAVPTDEPRRQPQHELPPELTIQSLRSVADALKGHIDAQQPWGPGDWANLLARSDRWHQELNRRVQNTPPPTPSQDLSWTSLISSHISKDGDQTIELTPLTTGRELIQAARDLHNCLSTYSQRCSQNKSRIFAVHQDGKLVAAAELVRQRNSWQVGQVEMRNRRASVPQPIQTAVAQTLQAYRKAEKAQRPPKTPPTP